MRDKVAKDKMRSRSGVTYIVLCTKLSAYEIVTCSCDHFLAVQGYVSRDIQSFDFGIMF